MSAAWIEWLREPALTHVDIDADDRMRAHAGVLARKPMLARVFREFHDLFETLDRRFFTAQGMRVELGAGVAPMRDSYPDVLATDVVEGPGLDRVLNAERMDLPTAALRTVIGQNCFHHFPHPDLFFAELERVVAPGGGAILLEPYYGPAASFLYKRLFRTEGFDKSFPDWETPSSGPMNGANQALSYIVFTRDRARFERSHPGLRIVHRRTCVNYPRYLLSGGLNFRQLCPDGATPLIRLVETALTPFARWLALHHVIVIRREP